VLLELAPTKLAHYPLPLYGALALLAGAGLKDAFEARTPRYAVALFVIAALGLCAVCGAAASELRADAAAGLRLGVWTALSLAIAVLGAGALLWRTRRPSRAVLVAVATSLLLVSVAREAIAPRAQRLFVSAQASRVLQSAGLHPRLQATPLPLLSVGFSEPSLVFLTRSDTLLRAGPAAAAAAQPGQAALVEAAELAMFQEALSARELRFAPVEPAIHGLNYSKGKPVTLLAGRVVSAQR